MRTRKWVGVASILAGSALAIAGTAAADVASDEAAAILVYPKIIHDEATDTIVQVSNTSNDPVILHCFYVNATSHCSASGRACDGIEDPCRVDEGLCLPGWTETDFQVFLTPRQPLAWNAADGVLAGEVPIDGRAFVGIGGSSNAGTQVPPTSEIPYIGELKCVVVDSEGRAIARNVVKGEATIVLQIATVAFSVEKYNAVGIQAIEGDANNDKILILGGDANEYNGCPNVLIADHFFDGAINPVNGQELTSQLTLVPCTEDLLNQIPGGTTVQYLVFNEFEQRFSTSTPIQCYFTRQLSLIDTRDEERSIFSVFVAGTLTGQTRIRGVNQGLLGILETATPGHVAGVNLHLQGDRDHPDQILLP